MKQTPRNAHDRTGQCAAESDLSVSKFVVACEARGYCVKESTPRENMVEHFDFRVTGPHLKCVIKWDYKGKKRKNGDRGEGKNAQSEWILLEIHGVGRKGNNMGWLYGATSDWITFEMDDCYLTVYRQHLIDWIDPIQKKIRAEHGVINSKVKPTKTYRLYTRTGANGQPRLDEFVWVPKEDLLRNIPINMVWKK